MTREELAARLYVEAADLLLEAQSEESKRLGKEVGKLKRQYIDSKLGEKTDSLAMNILNAEAKRGEISLEDYLKAREANMGPDEGTLDRLNEAKAAARNSPKGKARKIIADAADAAMKERRKRKAELWAKIDKRHENDLIYQAKKRRKKEAEDKLVDEIKNRERYREEAIKKTGELNRAMRDAKKAAEEADAKAKEAARAADIRVKKAAAIGAGAGAGLTAAASLALKNRKAIAANIAGRKEARNIIKNSDIKSLESHIGKLEELIADYEAQPASEKNAQATATYKKAKVTLNRLHKAYKNMLKQKAVTESVFDQLDDLDLYDFD